MKISKKEVWVFILICAFLNLLFQVVFMVMTDDEDSNTLIDMLINFPFILLMGMAILFIVHKVNQHFKYKDNLFIRVSCEFFLVAAFSFFFVYIVKVIAHFYFLQDIDMQYQKSATVVLLGNSFFMLMFELFLYNQRQLKTEKYMTVIQKERLEYMYTTLRTQVNPHFLFNSLNILSSLVYEDPQKANIYTKKLSNIYRYALSTNTHQYVTVQEEFRFLESYIYLVTIRFGEALHIHFKGNKAIEKQVIPISIQLLVENAIKHNVISMEHPLAIEVHVTPDYIEVSNNLQLRMNTEKNGVGLSNLQKQLDLYGKQLEIVKTNEQFIVRLPYV